MQNSDPNSDPNNDGEETPEEIAAPKEAEAAYKESIEKSEQLAKQLLKKCLTHADETKFAHLNFVKKGVSELEPQLCEQSGALQRRRIESIQFWLSALENLGGAESRDELRATDMVRTIAFGTSSSTTPKRPEDKEICIREFVNSSGRQKENPNLHLPEEGNL